MRLERSEMKPTAIYVQGVWGGAMALIIDARERKLIKQFAADQVVVETLDVGDILCKYEDGSGWIAERKTAGNLFCP